MRRAVFLDRDGVINKALVVNGTPTPAMAPDQLQILPKVGESVEMLRLAGFEIVVVTNQPDVARGNLSKAAVKSIHKRLQSELQIEHFYTCFHDDLDDCLCRKPKPGLLSLAAKEIDLDLSNSFLVGDRWKDIAAGQAVGCKCFFIDYSYAEPYPIMPYKKVPSLFEAVQIIVEGSSWGQ